MNTPVGFARPVLSPLMTLDGGTLPRWYPIPVKTRMDWLTSLATYNSPVSASNERLLGQFSWVRSPWITRNGGVSPEASRGWTTIDGGWKAPVPMFPVSYAWFRQHPFMFSDPSKLTA